MGTPVLKQVGQPQSINLEQTREPDSQNVRLASDGQSMTLTIPDLAEKLRLWDTRTGGKGHTIAYIGRFRRSLTVPLNGRSFRIMFELGEVEQSK